MWCLRGNRASYSFVNGSGDGITNWLVFLPGVGWCENFTYCLDYGFNRSTPPIPFAPYNYTGIASIHQLDNPEFYNWNKVVIRYCDGSSFTGNSKLSLNEEA
ncbi:hypothetical protein DM860_003801 [Cuscuta australis]|uniref:Pectin acetylesterase n=1 Tax=Cuscuta australis TaxID=267555 RepID=A0A328DH12_9ASTE|nr:hypothetical protein DM860_003801 [Cuscuta australis]